jgi:hypothetical protein
VLQCVGDHTGNASGFGLSSHGRIIASLSAIGNHLSEVEQCFLSRPARCALCWLSPYCSPICKLGSVEARGQAVRPRF